MSFCLSCQKLIPGGREELAKHIRDSKKGHRYSKRFARSVIFDVKRLDRKATLQSRPARVALTPEQKETKKSLVREVSGQFLNVTAWCPRGKHSHVMPVEVEYLQSVTAAKTEGGKLVISCGKCR